MASYLFNPDEYLTIYQDAAQAVAQGWMNVYQHFEAHGAGAWGDHFYGVNPIDIIGTLPDLPGAG